MASGGVAIVLGAGLALLTRDRVLVGRLIAAFLVAVVPGNIAQFVHKRDGFGLNSDSTRFVRLLFQPLLVAWALWSTPYPAARDRGYRDKGMSLSDWARGPCRRRPLGFAVRCAGYPALDLATEGRGA